MAEAVWWFVDVYLYVKLVALVQSQIVKGFCYLTCSRLFECCC